MPRLCQSKSVADEASGSTSAKGGTAMKRTAGTAADRVVNVVMMLRDGVCGAREVAGVLSGEQSRLFSSPSRVGAEGRRC